MLEKFLVVDLTHRLPGPLAGKILSDLGAEVLKVEDENFKDPFLSGLFNQKDNHFLKWYKELNDDKKLVRFDFKSPNAIEKMYELLNNADFLLLAQPQKINKMLGISSQTMEKEFPNLTVIELKAGEGKYKNLHDLNALALSGLLDMHLESNDSKIIKPPFLPVSGISFGHWVATKALAAKLSNKRWMQASLEEATHKILSPFKSSSSGAPKYLHNGKFPCYCLYKTGDNRTLAVATVEDKFWKRFVEIFKLELNEDDRFDTSSRVFDLISNKLCQLDSGKIEELLKDEDICLTLI